jgi:hypothetical protein
VPLPSEDDRYQQGYRDGYLRALEEWRRGSSPFAGVPPVDLVTRGASYAFRETFFDSFVDYEREVTGVLRDIERACWQALVRGGEDAGRQIALLHQFRREVVTDELWRVRSAVDAALERGDGRRCVVEAVRATPNRPDGVFEFASVEAFVAEDGRRAIGGWPQRHDAGGADYGVHWRLEDPLRRWEATTWRVSWLGIDADPTDEVYAIESQGRPLRKEDSSRYGRVWLLGRLRTEQSVDDVVQERMLYAMRERNSLVAVAKAVCRAAGVQRRRRGSM